LCLFLLSPYLLLVQLVLCIVVSPLLPKSARTPWVCNVGTSQEGSRMTSFWVCLFLGNNTHKMHCHHMTFDNGQQGTSPPNSSFLPPICVFLFLPIYPSILPSPCPCVVVGIKAKCEGR
jgi:hypothetical protein